MPLLLRVLGLAAISAAVVSAAPIVLARFVALVAFGDWSLPDAIAVPTAIIGALFGLSAGAVVALSVLEES